MTAPLVTVICICYNQARFVAQALRSVAEQTYSNIQLLIVDDASTDNSVEVITTFLRDFPDAQFFPLPQNVGNCKAFNHALRYAKGDYVIDLAADDMLLAERIAAGVEALTREDGRYAVNFSDAVIVDAEGKELYRHSQRFPHEAIPQGDVYRALIARYFILSPTIIAKTAMVKEIGGYDESLAYEDFDFMIRSSRRYWYCYTPECLVAKRIVGGSLSEEQFKFFSAQLRSTFRVCEKILTLNRTFAEQKALSQRIRYEIGVALRLYPSLAIRYAFLWLRNKRMKY